MWRLLRLGVLLPSAFGLGGCGGVPKVERDPGPLLQTSDLRYSFERLDIGYSASIPYEFRNRTGGNVYLRNCDGDVRPLLQVQRDGRWVDAWQPLTAGCESFPLVIRPGVTFVDTLRVLGAPPGSNVMPAFVFEDVEGIYRLLWFQAVSEYDPEHPETSTPLRLEHSVSNAFALTS